MRSIQATGKSVDAAIFSGLTQLGLSIDEVTIEVVQHETKGILGIGAKPAIVTLTEKPAEEVVIPDFTAELEKERRERRERRENRDNRGRDNRDNRGERRDRRPERPNRDRDSRPDEGRKEQKTSAEEAPAAENRPEGEPKPERTDRPRREHRPNRPEAQEPIPEKTPEKEIVYTEEAAQNEPSARFVAGLIEKMKLDGKVLAAKEEDAIRLRIDCEEMGVLIGHRGETLDAVQYLTSLVVNRNRKTEGYTRVTINTEDYREKREETLIRLAKRIAQQVKSSGSPKMLEPMNPYERRIIHSALQKHPYVTTHSEGEEPNRRVVISPKRRSARQYREHA
ncbi:MAG: protein jag [Clostridia bacterium]|nr:protein jag [Clostridia bacterium]